MGIRDGRAASLFPSRLCDIVGLTLAFEFPLVGESSESGYIRRFVPNVAVTSCQCPVLVLHVASVSDTVNYGCNVLVPVFNTLARYSEAETRTREC